MRLLVQIQSLLLGVNSYSCCFALFHHNKSRNIHRALAMSSTKPWTAGDTEQAKEAKKLDVWPLDEANAALLNQVHPRGYVKSNEPHEVYDLIAIGSGAGGLVSSKQAARRGAKRYVPNNNNNNKAENDDPSRRCCGARTSPPKQAPV